MKKNNIGYLLREGFRGVFLHGFMSFAAICVTVACLIIMGSFCLILYNTSAMVKELEQKNEMLVYIDESYSEAKAKSVGSQINLITNVRSATFVSRGSRHWRILLTSRTTRRCLRASTPIRCATAMSSQSRITRC